MNTAAIPVAIEKGVFLLIFLERLAVGVWFTFLVLKAVAGFVSAM